MNNPCPDCPYARDSHGACFQGTEVVTHSYDCGRWQRYDGYQEGLAEAESRVKAREQEIVEWLKKDSLYRRNPMDYQCQRERLEAWLGKE